MMFRLEVHQDLKCFAKLKKKLEIEVLLAWNEDPGGGRTDSTNCPLTVFGSKL